MRHILGIVALIAGCGAPPKPPGKLDDVVPARPDPDVSLALELQGPAESAPPGATYARPLSVEGFCSAVAIGRQTLATAGHCATSQATVWTREQYVAGARGYDVRWVHVDELADIAVGTIAGRFESFAPIRCTLPKGSDFLQHIHHGKRNYWRYDAGQMLFYESNIEDQIVGDLLIAALRVLPGSSGAGILDADNRLVGVVSAHFVARPEIAILSSIRNVEALCDPVTVAK